MKIIYNKINGFIIAAIPNEQSLESFAYGYDEETKKKLSSILCNEEINDLENYKIINNKLVKMTDQEIQEIQQYGRFLTEEERQLNKLKPPYDEIKKAENTIEILSLLQEVGI